MGRPRGFDETAVVAAAVGLFATRSYDGVSVDDLVSTLGVHRNSLYQTFGSKRGLYLRALDRAVRTAVDRVSEKGFPAEVFDLILLATLERAGHDAEVATSVGRAFAALDAVVGPAAATELIGRRVRDRAGARTEGHE